LTSVVLAVSPCMMPVWVRQCWLLTKPARPATFAELVAAS
jgi:hypothetical protein